MVAAALPPHNTPMKYKQSIQNNIDNTACKQSDHTDFWQTIRTYYTAYSRTEYYNMKSNHSPITHCVWKYILCCFKKRQSGLKRISYIIQIKIPPPLIKQRHLI